jgi:hypothetical protein
MVQLKTILNQKGYVTMKNNIIRLQQNNPEENLLTNMSLDKILQEGARKLLQAAIESEIDEYIERYKSLMDTEG